MCVVEALQATSLLAGAVFQLPSARAEKKAGLYTVQQTIQQAKISERNAAIERQEGIESARKERLKAIQNMASVKTDIAAGNIFTSSTSALYLIDDEKTKGDLNAVDILNESEKRSQAYLNSAMQQYNNAALYTFNTKLRYKNKGNSLLSKGVNSAVSAFSGLG